MTIFTVKKGGLTMAQAIARAAKTPEADVIDVWLPTIKSPITIKDMTGLTINGHGAKMDTGGKTYAILVDDSVKITVTGFELTDNRTGITVRDSHRINLSDIHSHHNTDYGAYIWRSNYVDVRNSEFDHNGAAGLSLHMSADIGGKNSTTYQNWIKNNSFHHNTYQTKSTEGWGWIIDESDVWRPKHVAAGYKDYTGKTLVMGNISYDNARAGGHVFHSDNVTVQDNVFIGNNADNASPGGELRLTEADHTKVTGNVMIADDDNFVFDVVRSDDVVATGNRGLVRGQGIDGVRLIDVTHSSIKPELNHWADKSLIGELDHFGVQAHEINWIL